MPPSIHLPPTSAGDAKETVEKKAISTSGRIKKNHKTHRRRHLPQPQHEQSAPPLSTTTTNGQIRNSSSSVGAANVDMTGGASTPMLLSSPSYMSAGMMSGGMYPGGMYSGNMYGGMSPYGGVLPPALGPLSNLNQFLFGVQNVVCSLGQAVQIIGMNTQAIHQLLETAYAVLDHASKTYKEMRMLEAAADQLESEEDKKRRRRLRALRWMMLTVSVYAGYKVLRLAIRRRRPFLQM